MTVTLSVTLDLASLAHVIEKTEEKPVTRHYRHKGDSVTVIPERNQPLTGRARVGARYSPFSDAGLVGPASLGAQGILKPDNRRIV